MLLTKPRRTFLKQKALRKLYTNINEKKKSLASYFGKYRKVIDEFPSVPNSKVLAMESVLSDLPVITDVKSVKDLLSGIPKQSINRMKKRGSNHEKDMHYINQYNTRNSLMPFLAKYYFYCENAKVSFARYLKDTENIMTDHRSRLESIINTPPPHAEMKEMHQRFISKLQRECEGFEIIHNQYSQTQ